jgi:hypothetical protein
MYRVHDVHILFQQRQWHPFTAKMPGRRRRVLALFSALEAAKHAFLVDEAHERDFNNWSVGPRGCSLRVVEK